MSSATFSYAVEIVHRPANVRNCRLVHAVLVLLLVVFCTTPQRVSSSPAFASAPASAAAAAAAAANSIPNVTYRISEDSPLGTRLGGVNGNVLVDSGLTDQTGAGNSSSVSFSFFPLVTSSSDFLSIDNRSGVISVSGLIDRAAICPYADVCQVAFDVLVRPSLQVRTVA